MMKSILFCTFRTVLFIFFLTTKAEAQYIRFATYNLRNENTYDTGNLWKDREPFVVDLIQYHDFDIFGVQEALPHQVEMLHQDLKYCGFYGLGRDDGKNEGEHSTIFYKLSKFDLLDKGDFWLSATPHIPSKSWDAPCCNRICSWVKLKDKKSEKTIFVFNAHYDYEKDYARNKSSELVLQVIDSIAKDQPVVFMGDLNGGNSDSWYKIIANSTQLKDTYVLAKHPYVSRGSFNDFGKANDGELIDHIFCSEAFEVKKWGLLTDTYGNEKYPSDHCPVESLLFLK